MAVRNPLSPMDTFEGTDVGLAFLDCITTGQASMQAGRVISLSLCLSVSLSR
jgi:hypothetical protein